MLNGMFGKMAEESIYQRKMIKKSEILSIKISGALFEGYNKWAQTTRDKQEGPEKYKTDYAQKMLKQKHYRSILLAVDKKDNEETNEKTQVPNPEALKFYTKMGIIVRSKSEVIIATALYDNNIKFEYEKAIKISDGIYYPDFTVEKKNGDIVLWEHLGLIDNPDYRNKAYRKILKYNENGYYQGKILYWHMKQRKVHWIQWM